MKLSDKSTVGIISLAGNCDEELIYKAKLNFENLGYNVKLSNNILHKKYYLAGSDDEKIEELSKFFADPDIDFIVCSRGGYGSIRIINNINYELIKNNPKPFCGFSDITALL